MLRLGRYEIEAEIGQGSMGVVYLANDPRVRRRLALKTYLLPHGLSREEEKEFGERFLREAQAAGALSHPAIVTVYDADEDPAEGIPFIAMEYVPGRSLREVLSDEGRLSPRRAFEIVLMLADALHAAHEAGIVHRDVKPANILVREPDGAVKIADFGVARLPTSELTRSGLSFGSPAYMAPEQFRGAIVDRRSDLFSLAVILYQALSGERPFGGSDLMSIAYAVVNEKPAPITRRVEGLSPALDAFFERGLAKEPEDRFQTGEEFRRALETAIRTVPEARPGSMPPPGAGTRTDLSGRPRGGAGWRPRVTRAGIEQNAARVVAWTSEMAVRGSAWTRQTAVRTTAWTREAAARAIAWTKEKAVRARVLAGGTAARASARAGESPRRFGTRKPEQAEGRLRARAIGAAAVLLVLALIVPILFNRWKSSKLAAGSSPTAGSKIAASGAAVTPHLPRTVAPVPAAAPGSFGPTRSNASAASSSPTFANPAAATATGGSLGRGHSPAIPPSGPTNGLTADTSQSSRHAARGSLTETSRPHRSNVRGGKGAAPDTEAADTKFPATPAEPPPTVPDPAIAAAQAAAMSAAEADASLSAPADAAPVPSLVKATGLALVVKSNIGSGTLRILVDDKEVFSRRLTAAGKENKGFWKKVFTKSAESFKARILLVPGKHDILAQVIPDGEALSFSQSAAVDLKSGESHKLRLTVGKENGPPLILEVD